VFLLILVLFIDTFFLPFFIQSPVDGKPMLLTPEESIQIQVGRTSLPILMDLINAGVFNFFFYEIKYLFVGYT